MRRTCDTQHYAAGWEAFVNDAALDVGEELAVEVGWGEVAGVDLKHMSRHESDWAARGYRTLLHGVANWIASGNEVDIALDSSKVDLWNGYGRSSSTVSASGSAAGSSSDGNGAGSRQESVWGVMG